MSNDILSRIADIDNPTIEEDEAEYEHILKDLADRYLDMETLDQLNTWTKVSSIYTCKGPYVFEEHGDEEDDEYEW